MFRSGAQWVFLRTGGKIYKTKPQITTARRHESGGIRHRKQFEDFCKTRKIYGREFACLALSRQIPQMFYYRKKRSYVHVIDRQTILCKVDCSRVRYVTERNPESRSVVKKERSDKFSAIVIVNNIFCMNLRALTAYQSIEEK